MTTLDDGIDEAGGRVHFFASKSGALAREIRAEHDVNVSWADAATARFVSVSGTARFAGQDQMRIMNWIECAAKNPDFFARHHSER